MNSPWEKNRRRLLHLLADRALFGLCGEETAELEELFQSGLDIDRDLMERVATRCDLALGIAMPEQLPTGLRERIRADAESVLAYERG